MNTAPLIRTRPDRVHAVAARDLPQSTYALIRRTATAQPDASALSFILQGHGEDTPLRLTGAERLGKTAQTANAFHRLGLRPGKAVSFLLPNLPQPHFTLWGDETAVIVNAINPLPAPAHIAEHLAGFAIGYRIHPPA